MFRRAQALAVVLALLCAPLALYARSVAGDMSTCNGICCLPQHHHTPQPAEQPATVVEPECHHHSANAAKASAVQHHIATASADAEAARSCAFHCAMHSKTHTMNFGLLAPIAPTKPSDLAAIRISIHTASAALALTNHTQPGFLASPFQPPRA